MAARLRSGFSGCEQFRIEMANDITIQVLDGDESPVSGVKVEVSVDGSMMDEGVGGDLEPEYTDEDGHAYFTTACDYPAHALITIRVDGSVASEERIGGGSFTVHLP